LGKTKETLENLGTLEIPLGLQILGKILEPWGSNPAGKPHSGGATLGLEILGKTR